MNEKLKRMKEIQRCEENEQKGEKTEKIQTERKNLIFFPCTIVGKRRSQREREINDFQGKDIIHTDISIAHDSTKRTHNGEIRRQTELP